MRWAWTNMQAGALPSVTRVLMVTLDATSAIAVPIPPIFLPMALARIDKLAKASPSVTRVLMVIRDAKSTIAVVINPIRRLWPIACATPRVR